MIDDFNNTIVSDEIYNILQKYNWKKFLKSKENFVFNRNGEIADYYLNISYEKERLYFECILDMEFPEKRIYDLYTLCYVVKIMWYYINYVKLYYIT